MTNPIKLSELRPYMKVWDRTRYQDMFNEAGAGKRKNIFRLYMKLVTAENEELAPPAKITYHLWSMEAECLDYRAGIVKLKDGRLARLGKILARTPDLLPLFENDERRHSVNKENQIVVICRHPLDVVTMSYNRGWSSCLRFRNGEQEDTLIHEVEQGSLVAYLIDADDIRIKSPSARIVLRAYDHADGGPGAPRIFAPAESYGTGTKAFAKTVRAFADRINLNSPPGLYELCDGIYRDENEDELRHFGRMSREDILALEEDQLLVAASLNCASGELLSMLEGYSIAVDMRLSNNVAAPLSILGRLASSPSEEVRCNVAENRHTSSRILSGLAPDSSAQVRARVAGNRHTPYSAIVALFKDTSENVLSNLIYRVDALPSDLYRDLAKTATDEAVIKLLAGSPQVRHQAVAEIVRQHISEDVRVTLAANLSCHKDAANKLVDDPSSAVRTMVAKSGATSNEVAETLFNDPDEDVRLALARRRLLSKPVLTAMVKDSSQKIRMALAERGDLTIDIQELLARDPDWSVRLELSKRSGLATSACEILMHDRATSVRENIARITYSTAVLDVLSRDTRASVLKAVAKNRTTPIPSLRAMLHASSDTCALVLPSFLSNSEITTNMLAELANDTTLDLDARVKCAQKFGYLTGASQSSLSDFLVNFGSYGNSRMTRRGMTAPLMPFMNFDFTGLERRIGGIFSDSMLLDMGLQRARRVSLEPAPSANLVPMPASWHSQVWGLSNPDAVVYDTENSASDLAGRLEALGISPHFLTNEGRSGLSVADAMSRDLSNAIGTQATVTGSSYDSGTGCLSIDLSVNPSHTALVSMSMVVDESGLHAFDFETAPTTRIRNEE